MLQNLRYADTDHAELSTQVAPGAVDMEYPFDDDLLAWMTDAEARSSAGNGMHIVHVGVVFLLVYALCADLRRRRSPGEDADGAAACGTAATGDDPHESTAAEPRTSAVELPVGGS
jgi:hypothetical protein